MCKWWTTYSSWLEEWRRLRRQHLSKTTAIHNYDPEDKFTEREVKRAFKKRPCDWDRRHSESIQISPVIESFISPHLISDNINHGQPSQITSQNQYFTSGVQWLQWRIDSQVVHELSHFLKRHLLKRRSSFQSLINMQILVKRPMLSANFSSPQHYWY